MNGVPTADQMATWPVTVDVVTAGRALGLGRDGAYSAARSGQLPGVIRIGRRLVVVVATLRAALGVEPPTGNGDAGDVHELFARTFGDAPEPVSR